jgi:4-hydroxythreonine-4-phosphate dehydrogenase
VKPRLAVVMGDPTGIGPEILVRALARADVVTAVDPVVVCDRRVIARAAALAGTALSPAIEIVDLAHCPPEEVPLGTALPRAGRAAGQALARAFELAARGEVAGVGYAPLHKRSLHDGGYPFEDELHLFAHWTASADVGEINALDSLWTSRVTSHIGLARVAAELSVDRVLRAVRLIDRAQRAAGWPRPRIAIAAFNPHGGEHGLFGDEELRVIEPAVDQAREEGLDARGPIPADTVFVRARGGEFDAVVTMYHDQGQIAMKLLGFDRGVTLAAGLLFPVTTPAHGTAHDIAAKGITNPGAMIAALKLATQMASRGGLRPQRDSA